MQLPSAAIGAVLAATIAGCISLLGLIIAKEHKISEFRQQWIDSLRENLSSLIAHVNAMHGHLTTGSGPVYDRWLKAREDFLGANRHVALIRLRLNPSEPLAGAVLQHVQLLDAALSSDAVPDQLKLNEIEKQLVESARGLLKEEWLRVRQGEAVYRAVRIVAAMLVVSGSALLLVIALAGRM